MRNKIKADDIKAKGRFAVIIPVFNHDKMAPAVIKKALALGIPVIAVDDGSTDSSYQNIKKIKWITILRHEKNTGKGAAIKTGFAEASKIADWAITIDADGQHDPSDALRLINAVPAGSRPIVIGMREDMSGSDVPWTSKFGRGFSNFWVRLSGGPKVRDSQSGFRIYPLPEADNLKVKAKRFQFEVEILTIANWKNIPVIECPVSVTYTPGEKRISHFRPFVDFIRNSKTFTRLIILRLIIPMFIRKRYF